MPADLIPHPYAQETYLFNAACSELSAEVKKNRRAADENTRQQRTLLQHEVDIVTQRMSQDLQTLKDDVKGMFNDRKMTVREEQRNMESQVGLPPSPSSPSNKPTIKPLSCPAPPLHPPPKLQQR